MQYIGDAKSGRLIGADQYVTESVLSLTSRSLECRFGNKYFENLNPEEEVPGMFVVEKRFRVVFDETT